MIEPKKITDDQIITRIVEMLGMRGITEEEMIRKLGMSRGTFAAWKRGKIRPHFPAPMRLRIFWMR